MGSLVFLDDVRQDDDFLECMRRRATELIPLEDRHKWVILSYDKLTGNVTATPSEPLSMPEVVWIFDAGRNTFEVVE